MQASIVDLRYNMKSVLGALDRNEQVEIYYHGKLKGILLPVSDENNKCEDVTEHEFFGMYPECEVDEEMNNLRGLRYRDL